MPTHKRGGNKIRFSYGNYLFDANATLFTSSSQVKWNTGGQPYAHEDSVHVTGFLTGTGQADLTQKASALATALAVNFNDLVFLDDTGAQTQTVLKNVSSITGVRIKNLEWPTSQGPEYATIRSFSFDAMAEYPLARTATLLLSFTETLSFAGGGPLFAHRLAINGLPQKQLIYPATVFRATQSGHAEGYLIAPTVPQPQWPNALKQSGDLKRTSPERKGRGYQGYGVQWSFEFESAYPLIGIPTLWTSN